MSRPSDSGSTQNVVNTAAVAHLIKGADPVLVGQRLGEVMASLAEAGSTDVEEFAGTEYELGEVVMAASTPSMFGSRVLVARNASRFNTAAIGPLVDWVNAPMEGSTVVIVWEKGEGDARMSPVPKPLQEALASKGQVHDVSVPTGRGKDDWVRAQLDGFSVRLDRAAKSLILDRIGDDVGRLVGLQRTLEGAFGEGTTVSADDIEPFVGQHGTVPPWDLTDAIDRGDAPKAVATARRMIADGERHPLQVMASLVTHFKNIAALDGASCANERDAAAVLGMKGSTFPAKKALAAAQKLGHGGVADAIELLADADVDLRGGIGWPPELVLEMLVARLANLANRGRRGATAARR